MPESSILARRRRATGVSPLGDSASSSSVPSPPSRSSDSAESPSGPGSSELVSAGPRELRWKKPRFNSGTSVASQAASNAGAVPRARSECSHRLSPIGTRNCSKNRVEHRISRHFLTNLVAGLQYRNRAPFSVRVGFQLRGSAARPWSTDTYRSKVLFQQELRDGYKVTSGATGTLTA